MKPHFQNMRNFRGALENMTYFCGTLNMTTNFHTLDTNITKTA